MTQRPLFAKAVAFRRPRYTTGKYGDRYRVWLLRDGSAKVVCTTSICGIPIRRTFKAILITPTGEALVSVHRKVKPAQAAVVKATDIKPTPKRRKVRR